MDARYLYGERGFTPEEIADAKTGTMMTQADGATVFVKGLGRGKYNVVVEGEGGFVTGMKNLSGAEVAEVSDFARSVRTQPEDVGMVSFLS